MKRLLKKLKKCVAQIEDRQDRSRYVYAYLRKGKVLYVGRGRSAVHQAPWQRAQDIKQHPTVYQYLRENPKTILRVEIWETGLTLDEARGYEKAAILAYQPELNIQNLRSRAVILGKVRYNKRRWVDIKSRIRLSGSALAAYREAKARQAERSKQKRELKAKRIEEYGSEAEFKKVRNRERQAKYKEANQELTRLRSNKAYHKRAGNLERVAEIENRIQEVLAAK